MADDATSRRLRSVRDGDREGDDVVVEGSRRGSDLDVVGPLVADADLGEPGVGPDVPDRKRPRKWTGDAP